MIENQDTAQTMKGLAVSKKNPTFIAMPQNSAHNRVQLLSNQRTNRHLSRVSVTPQVTPIWQQQTFTPSPEIQKRFGQQQPPENETVTIQPDAPPRPTVPAAVKPPMTQQPTAPVADPVTATPAPIQQVPQVQQPQKVAPNALPPQGSQGIQNTPGTSNASTVTAPTQPQPDQAAVKPTIEPTAVATKSVVSPETKQDTEMPELVQVVEEEHPPIQQESEKSISDLLDELSSSVKKPTSQTEVATVASQQPVPVQQESKPIFPPDTRAQTAEAKSQKEDKTETQPEQQTDESSNLSTEALANSLSVLSDLRQQIHDQEEKLQSMREELPEIQRKKLEYLTEQKTKGALLKNVEHALLNSKQELDKLRNEPGANQELIKNLEDQLEKQQDTFNKLANEQKRLDKKAEELQQKLQEHEEAEKTLGDLEQQHEQLNTAETTETAKAATEDEQAPELDPAIRQLINQTMAIDQNIAQVTRSAAPQPAPPTQPQPAPAQSAASPTADVQIKMPTITNEINAINGVVTDTNKKLVTDAIVIIKNGEGRPLRALKTNQLGQYWITTALDNGKYSLETEKEGMTFDTIEVELTGKPVEPILIPAST